MWQSNSYHKLGGQILDDHPFFWSQGRLRYFSGRLFSTECIVSMQEQIREIGPCSGADKGDVAERALQRAIEEYRLQRPELVRTEFHSRSLEGIAGQLEQETAGY